MTDESPILPGDVFSSTYDGKLRHFRVHGTMQKGRLFKVSGSKDGMISWTQPVHFRVAEKMRRDMAKGIVKRIEKGQAALAIFGI